MNWEQEHKKRIEANVKKIDAIYQTAAIEAAQIGASIKNFNPDKPFSFDHYPKTYKRIDKLLSSLQTQLYVTIATGSKLEWDQANLKNDKLILGILGLKGDEDKEKNPVIKKFFNNNEAAREAFIARKSGSKGLGLSQRVWNYTNQFKTEVEMALDDGIRDGHPAAKMARDVRKFLVEPDRVYRRFQMHLKDANGNPVLDKNGNKIVIKQERRRYIDPETGKVTWRVESPKYKPGQGVYKSSAKNAKRLTRSENNMAYRMSDQVRMQQLDFIVGQEIKLSKAHAIYDICDHLKGKYPKEYVYTGWHTQCFCYRVFILKTPEELAIDTQKILAGEEPTSESVNLVKSVPGGYTDWIAANMDRIKKAKSIPYFIADNHVGGDISKGLSFASPVAEKALKAVKTEAQKKTIQVKWDARKLAKVQSIPKGLSSDGEYLQGTGIKLSNEFFGLIDNNSPVGLKIDKKLRGSNYDPSRKLVNLANGQRGAVSKWHRESVVYHEYGHAIDWQRGLRTNGEATAMMDKYRKILSKKATRTITVRQFDYNLGRYVDKKVTSTMSGYAYIEARVDAISQRLFRVKPETFEKLGISRADVFEQIGSLKDTIMALNPSYGYGHTKAYFKRPYAKEAEFIAHCFENKYATNTVFKKYMSELYADMVKYIEALK